MSNIQYYTNFRCNTIVINIYKIMNASQICVSSLRSNFSVHAAEVSTASKLFDYYPW